ncbi:hypothetical protein D030_2791B, partial [Vibrio parahaemolyticus AQ3810]
KRFGRCLATQPTIVSRVLISPLNRVLKHSPITSTSPPQLSCVAGLYLQNN